MNLDTAFYLIIAVLGAVALYTQIGARRGWPGIPRWLVIANRDPQQGGYVHDTAMSQYIPPTLFNPVTGTWTYAAGAVTGTIARHVAPPDQPFLLNIPF